jgi:effector-binding domain-containing protein
VRVTTVLSAWPKEFMVPLNAVYDAVKAGRVCQNGHNVMVYYPRPDGRVDIECGIETAQRFEPFGNVGYSETPPGRAVATTHIGPWEQLGSSHAAVTAWSRSNGIRLAGTCWEIYGDWEEDPAKRRAAVFHLVLPPA